MIIPVKVINEWMAAPDLTALRGMMIPVLATLTDDELVEAHGAFITMANGWIGQFENCPPFVLEQVAYKALEGRNLA